MQFCTTLLPSLFLSPRHSIWISHSAECTLTISYSLGVPMYSSSLPASNPNIVPHTCPTVIAHPTYSLVTFVPNILPHTYPSFKRASFAYLIYLIVTANPNFAPHTCLSLKRTFFFFLFCCSPNVSSIPSDVKVQSST